MPNFNFQAATVPEVWTGLNGAQNLKIGHVTPSRHRLTYFSFFR